MLSEKTYNVVYKSLRAATDAMGAVGNAELLKDEEDMLIYKQLLRISSRLAKRGGKAQKLERAAKRSSQNN